jgi:hypothetical protein
MPGPSLPAASPDSAIPPPDPVAARLRGHGAPHHRCPRRRPSFVTPAGIRLISAHRRAAAVTWRRR